MGEGVRPLASVETTCISFIWGEYGGEDGGAEEAKKKKKKGRSSPPPPLLSPLSGVKEGASVFLSGWAYGVV